MSKRFVILLSLAALIIYAWPMWQWLRDTGQKDPQFVIDPPIAAAENAAPYFSEQFINPVLRGRMVHAASICQLKDGSLAAVWYGGSREGASDTAIYLSTRHPGVSPSWSKPKVVVNGEIASGELRRYVKTVGNCIIFTDYDDRLWLIYVTVSVGGWSGSSLDLKTSSDAGTNWTTSQRLTLSPFLNLAELVRNDPLSLVDGGFTIPIYHEFVGRFPELLRIGAGVQDSPVFFRKSRMAGGRSYIQPTIVPYGPTAAVAFYRNCSDARRVGIAFTGDAGATWSAPRNLDLPNPDSALNALLLSNGNILVAFNDSQHSRENLRLAVSRDRGVNWIRVATLDDMNDQEFSYPYMIKGQNGMIHMVYTWGRKRIKYVQFNEAWIWEKLRRASE
jgi:predicted neuraminidase